MKALFILVLFSTTLYAEPSAHSVFKLNSTDCSEVLKTGPAETLQTNANPIFIEDSNFAQTNCCKVCKKGQACGNSCISWDKVCHQAPGCACQG